MEPVKPYTEALLAATSERNVRIASFLEESCKDTHCAMTVGTGHLDEAQDLDEVLPGSLSLWAEPSISAYRSIKEKPVDPPEIIYSEADNDFYYVPALPKGKDDATIQR